MRNNLLIAGIIILTLLILAILLSFLYPGPPIKNIEKAKNEIALARKMKANIYAETTFNKAELLYNKMMEEWKYQNSRFFIFRNFNKVDEYSLQIIALCSRSHKEANENLNSLIKKLNLTFDKYLKTANICDTLIKALPFSKNQVKDYTRLKLSLLQAYNYFVNSEYKESDHLLKNIAVDYEIITTDIINISKMYFVDHEKWVKWHDNLVLWSRKNNAYAIFVDKMARVCRLYNSGKIVAEYPVDLGQKWMGNKHYQGDNATPEGMYKIIKKLGKNQSIYYKAFLLNYPNDEDKKRFSEGKKTGKIPHNAKIGGLIEIHGEGGKGVHWTNGCVALSNRHMDELFNKVEIGTPVLIVGSLKSFNELFNFE